jgi:hypothetical protein
VHGAGLHRGGRPGRLDRLGKPGQPITTDDEHVAYPTVAQLGAHPSPKLRALTGLHPDPEHVLGSVKVDTHRNMRGPVTDLVAIADLHHERIEVDDRVDLLQRPALPGLDLLEHRVSDLPDRLVGQLGAQRAGQVMADITHRHPTRVQRNNHLVQAAAAPGALGNQPRLKRPSPIPRHV